jgi:hypothetical protein
MKTKTAEEILAEAPTSRLGFKVAFVCLACRWWASDWSKCKTLDSEPKVLKKLYCAACGAPTKDLPLEDLIEGTQIDNPENFDAFIACHSDNWTGEYANGTSPKPAS